MCLTAGHGVDCWAGLDNGDVASHLLDQQEDEDAQQGGEQCAEQVVVGAGLVHAHNGRNQKTDHIHPCNCAGKCKASNNCIEGLGLELECNVTNCGGHLLKVKEKITRAYPPPE